MSAQLRLVRCLCNNQQYIGFSAKALTGFSTDDVSVLPVRNTRGSGTHAHKYILTHVLSQALMHTPADTHSSCPSSTANMESKAYTSDNTRNSVNSSR